MGHGTLPGKHFVGGITNAGAVFYSFLFDGFVGWGEMGRPIQIKIGDICIRAERLLSFHVFIPGCCSNHWCCDIVDMGGVVTED
jgi:hypothetical protein